MVNRAEPVAADFCGGAQSRQLPALASRVCRGDSIVSPQILDAFGEVENSLSGIQHLAVQSEAQERAVTSARRAADLAADRYRSGIVAYIEVVDANRDALTAERANAQLAGQRLIASVQLVKALGGGWNNQVILACATRLNSQFASGANK